MLDERRGDDQVSLGDPQGRISLVEDKLRAARLDMDELIAEMTMVDDAVTALEIRFAGVREARE